MNHRSTTTVRILSAVLGAFSLHVFADEVFVQGSEAGHGFTRPMAGRCFVIAPKHVIGSPAPGKITGVAAGSVYFVAQEAKDLPGDFSAVVVNEGSVPCADWTVPQNLQSLLESQPQGYLKLRGEDGIVSNVQVTLRTVGDVVIQIKPTDPADSLYKGMSGAALYVNGVMAGLLLSVTDSKHGEVYRSDRIPWQDATRDREREQQDREREQAVTILTELLSNTTWTVESNYPLGRVHIGIGLNGTSRGYVREAEVASYDSTYSPMNGAKVGQVLFTLPEYPVGKIKKGKGSLGEEWYVKYRGELNYYGSVSPLDQRCQGKATPLEVEVTAVWIPKRKLRKLNINAGPGWTNWNKEQKDCVVRQQSNKEHFTLTNRYEPDD